MYSLQIVFYFFMFFTLIFSDNLSKVRKRAKIRNQYNQAPDLGNQWESDNVTIRHHKREPKRSALSQQVTTRHQQTEVHESITKQDRNSINDPQKKHRLGLVSKNILLEGLNRSNDAQTSP